MTRPTEAAQPSSSDASTRDAIAILLEQAPGAGSGAGDTAAALVEVYERMEQSYRAAAIAGRVPAQASSTTNFA